AFPESPGESGDAASPQSTLRSWCRHVSPERPKGKTVVLIWTTVMLHHCFPGVFTGEGGVEAALQSTPRVRLIDPHVELSRQGYNLRSPCLPGTLSPCWLRTGALPAKFSLRLSLTPIPSLLNALTAAAIACSSYRNASFTADDLCNQILVQNACRIDCKV